MVLPICGFDQWTKQAIEARDAKAKRDADYSGTSPHAPYSAARNQRLLQKAEDKHYKQVEDIDEDDYQMNASEMSKSNDAKQY